MVLKRHVSESRSFVQQENKGNKKSGMYISTSVPIIYL